MIMFAEAPRRRWLASGALGVLLIFSAGCARYAPHPITAGRVDASLTPPSEHALSVAAAQLDHPLLPAVALRPEQGLTPDTAAVLAVLLNPGLRAARDARGSARAELLQAGILPNPQLSYSSDFVTGGNTADTVSAYGIGLSWDLRALLTHGAAVSAARRHSQVVNLDIAWQEWQVAESAKMAVYDLLALEQQLARARQIATDLDADAARIRAAVAQHDRTITDQAAAEAASQDAQGVVLDLQQQAEHQRLMLRRLIGLPADAPVKLQERLTLPTHLDMPDQSQLLKQLPQRRLDLVALRRGYASQEQRVRQAVLEQFPNVNIGFAQASDTSNVHTTGFGVSIDLPIFDRNQGNIAIERATRRQLYDDYVTRVHEARSDVAIARSNVRALNGEIAQAQSTLPTLQHLMNVYEQAYERGDVDALTYSGARHDFYQRQLDLLKLQQALLDNKVALELATGLYMPDAVTAPPATTAAATNPETQP